MGAGIAQVALEAGSEVVLYDVDPSAIERAREGIRGGLERRAAKLEHAAGKLRALAPHATLERGYSIVRGPDGAVLRDAASVATNDEITVRLQHGELGARVETVRDSGR